MIGDLLKQRWDERSFVEKEEITELLEAKLRLADAYMIHKPLADRGILDNARDEATRVLQECYESLRRMKLLAYERTVIG